jgi:adenosyl cobinamide kinase/adenosyl cobinamide phosphate guanylyltransferase
MNKELISKLRKQSKVDPKEIVKALANTNDGKVVEHWLEQFAEQIVRECVKVVNEVGSDVLYEHFGVEE